MDMDSIQSLAEEIKRVQKMKPLRLELGEFKDRALSFVKLINRDGGHNSEIDVRVIAMDSAGDAARRLAHKLFFELFDGFQEKYLAALKEELKRLTVEDEQVKKEQST